MGRQHSFFIHFEGGRLGNMIISTERRLSGDRLETNWSELRGFEAGPRPSGGRRPIYNQVLLKFSALSRFCQLVGSILSSCKEGAEVHRAVFLWYHKYFLAYFIETLPRAHRARGIESSNFIECLKLKNLGQSSIWFCLKIETRPELWQMTNMEYL